MVDTEYLLDLIDEKESLFAIPYVADLKFDISMHEYAYLWALKMTYFFKKIENKDRLINEIIELLNSFAGGLAILEVRKLKIKLDIFVRYNSLYNFKDS